METEIGGGREVHDEGVVWGSGLRGEDFTDGGGIERVGSEAVDCFGGKGDEVIGAEEAGGLRKV